MDAQTLSEEAGPGWRELVEHLHEQIDAAREREAALLRLLDMDRQALLQLTGASRPRPAPVQPPRPPSPLHAQILALLAEHPSGCTRAQVEAALETTQPLGDVLHGLYRRGRLTRVSKGVYALAPGPNATRCHPAGLSR